MALLAAGTVPCECDALLVVSGASAVLRSWFLGLGLARRRAGGAVGASAPIPSAPRVGRRSSGVRGL
jgi:hypothetical protein